MITENIENRTYLKSEIFSSDKITHAFTTKLGGVSRGKIEGLNLGFRCGDDEKSVTANYRLVAADLGVDYEKIIASRQTHSTNIRIVTEADYGKGVSRESDITETDGLITTVKGLPLVIFYADCVPVLLADEKTGVVAAVHSGWRGTVGRILENAVEMMCGLGAVRENIKAAIGPSIGPCCFETGAEVAELFEDRYKRERGEKFMVDLWGKNRDILTESGVLTENIDVLGMCTVHRRDILYSYRSHGEHTGRMGGIISING